MGQQPYMHAQYETGVYGIVVTVNNGSGSLDGSTLKTNLGDVSVDREEEFDAAIDGFEALVLAHACAGINICDERYIEGMEVAIEAIANQFS